LRWVSSLSDISIFSSQLCSSAETINGGTKGVVQTLEVERRNQFTISRLNDNDKNPCKISLLSKQAADTLENTVLLRVVRVVFAGDFEDSWERIGECVDDMADALCDLE
jgi:hypothetical protein